MNTNTNDVTVIAIDGPSASGKGTVAQRVAAKLGFHYLDSGALYRLVALATMRAKVDLSDERAISDVAAGLNVVPGGGRPRYGIGRFSRSRSQNISHRKR